MGLRKLLVKKAKAVSQRAVEQLFADEKRAAKIGQALGNVQRGKKALDRSQDEFLRALSFAPQSDFKIVSKQLAGLKRRLRELESKLDSLSRE